MGPVGRPYSKANTTLRLGNPASSSISQTTLHTFPDQGHDDIVKLGQGGLILPKLHVVERPVPRHMRLQGAVFLPVVLASLKEGETLVGPLC